MVTQEINPYSSLLDHNMTTEERKITPIPVVPKITGTWKEIIIRWTFEQGFSNVMLAGILIASVLGIPKVLIPSIHDGYKLNAAALKESSESYSKSTEKIIKIMVDQHERDRATFERAVDILEHVHTKE